MEEKTKQNKVGVEWETMKMAWNLGSVNGKKTYFGEVKNFQDC